MTIIISSYIFFSIPKLIPQIKKSIPYKRNFKYNDTMTMGSYNFKNEKLNLADLYLTVVN